MSNKKWISIGICVLFISTVFSMAMDCSWEREENEFMMEDAVVMMKDTVESKSDINVVISKPRKGYLYYHDREIIPLYLATTVIGPITIEVNATGDSFINKVEFYVDDKLQHTDFYSPYSWECYEKMMLWHRLKVQAFDREDNSASDVRPLIFFNRQTTPPEDLPPDPYITNPSNNWDLYGDLWNVTAICGQKIRIIAVELHLASDVVSTLFEYSANGEQWTFIGEDDDPSFEGEWFGEEGGVRNGEGLGGWNVWWNISDLPEGHYYIRATMRDEAGQEGSHVCEVYNDPSPPMPEIQTPAFESQVTGLVQFEVTTFDEDVSYYQLELFNGSKNTVTQKNLGDNSQYDTGPNVDGSRRLDGDNNFCGPTAVANGMWRLANKNKKLKEFGGKQLSLTDLAKLLAKKMAPTIPEDDASKTKGLSEIQKKGVTPEQMEKGVEDYLKEIGLGCDNDDGYSVKIIHNPTWEQYHDQLKSGQCVIIFIIPKGKTSGGHFVAGRSANTKANNDKSHGFGTVDSKNEYGAADKSGTWDKGNNVRYDNKDQYVHSLIIICPKNSSDIPKDTFVSIDPAGRDRSSSGGWVVGYDSGEVRDGFFLFRASMVDGEGITGTDSVSVYVNNNPPNPEIVHPHDGDVRNGTVFIEVIDDLNSKDIGITDVTYQSFAGGIHGVVFEDEDCSDGWGGEWNTTTIPDGTYILKATMTDYAGGEGVDSIEVHVDNVLDITPPIVEITSPENNAEISIPHINVTGHAFDSGSGIVRMDYLWEWQGGSTNDSRSYDPPRSEISFKIEIFDLREGWNSVTVGAEDAAGNYGTDMVNIFYVADGEDTTPPTTTKEIGEPNWEDGYAIAPYTPIWLNAIDYQSGVASIYYEIAWDSDEDGVWDETFWETVAADSVEIHVEDWEILYGIIELRWYAVDNAENEEQMHYQEHYVVTE